MPLATRLGAQAGFKKELVTHLQNNTELKTVLGLIENTELARIYDTPPDNWQDGDNNVYPFIIFARIDGSDLSTDTDKAWSVDYELVVLSRYRGMSEVEDILQAIDSVAESLTTPFEFENSAYSVAVIQTDEFSIERIASDDDDKGLTTQGRIVLRAHLWPVT